MKKLYYFLILLLSFCGAQAQQQYFGREKAVITLEGRNGYSNFTFVANPMDIKILDNFSTFQFTIAINNCSGSSQKDSLPMLSDLMLGDRYPNIVFTGFLPPNIITTGDATAEQSFSISGEMEIAGFKRVFPLNIKLWLKDKELGYSFSIVQDLKNYNVIVPDKYRRVLSGKISIASSGGVMISRPD